MVVDKYLNKATTITKNIDRVIDLSKATTSKGTGILLVFIFIYSDIYTGTRYIRDMVIATAIYKYIDIITVVSIIQLYSEIC